MSQRVSKSRRKKSPQKSRVRQMELPSEDIRRPAKGDWSAWEASARRQLQSSAARVNRPRRVRDPWGNLVHPDELKKSA